MIFAVLFGRSSETYYLCGHIIKALSALVLDCQESRKFEQPYQGLSSGRYARGYVISCLSAFGRRLGKHIAYTSVGSTCCRSYGWAMREPLTKSGNGKIPALFVLTTDSQFSV